MKVAALNMKVNNKSISVGGLLKKTVDTSKTELGRKINTIVKSLSIVAHVTVSQKLHSEQIINVRIPWNLNKILSH